MNFNFFRRIVYYYRSVGGFYFAKMNDNKRTVKKPEDMSREELIAFCYEVYRCYKEIEAKYNRLEENVYQSLMQFDSKTLEVACDGRRESERDVG